MNSRSLFNLTNVIHLKHVFNFLHYQILVITTHGKYKRVVWKQKKLSWQDLYDSNQLRDHILYQIFKIIFSKWSKSIKHWIITHQWKYISTESKIELHLKLKLDVELWTPATMKLLGSKKS